MHLSAPHAPEDARAALRDAIAHIGHLLPAQAPIRDFVHHNTLHADQHRGFDAAVAAASARTGAQGYLSEDAFRQRRASGRIRSHDLRAALEERHGAALDAVVATIGGQSILRRAVWMAQLEAVLGPIPASRLSHEQRQGTAFTAFAPGVTAADAARLGDPAEALPALWDAVTAAGAALPASAAPAQRATDALDALWASAAGQGTARDLLLCLTGEDLDARTDGPLIRALSAFLDDGLAPWAPPGRSAGFWAAWKAAAGTDAAWGWAALDGAGGLISALPDDPLDALAALLDAMGVPPARRDDTLTRTALRLPGWGGMAHGWAQAGGGVHARAPMDLASLLAARVALEKVHGDALCQRVFGVPLRWDALGEALRGRAAETVLRHSLLTGSLEAGLASRALRAIAEGDAAACAALWDEAQAARAASVWRPEDHGWRLFRLCQLLGVPGEALADAGASTAAALLAALEEFPPLARQQVWQDALEAGLREQVLDALAARREAGLWSRDTRPAAQIAFCMDDREEGIRRHLEAHHPSFETFGVAGFFGVPMHFQGLDDRASFPLCPIVVRPVNAVREVPRPGAEAAATAHAAGRARLAAWQTWRNGLQRSVLGGALALDALGVGLAVPFALRLAAPRLHRRATAALTRALVPPASTTLTVTAAPADTAPVTADAPRDGFAESEQADRVAGLLRNMGLVADFSRLVVLMGHGSISQNNPHLAAYDCGACSGRHGGPNARAFAAMANRPPVRAALAQRGIAIPADTWFLGAEHNTCDEAIDWFDLDLLPESHHAAHAALVAALDDARAHSAHERCRKLFHAPPAPTPSRALRHVEARSLDVAQPRPELGHATNAIAVVGRRALTRGLFLDRRAFLVSYDPGVDPDGRVLEGILAAVGPVGAGINLEYYFSTVDNEGWGCGSKVPHNLVGLVGVMEGSESDLRTGLPRQMIEVHEPVRLLLVVEATPATLLGIAARQPGVHELVAGAWVQLVSVDPATGAAARFRPGVGFVPVETDPGRVPRIARSADWYAGTMDFVPPALLTPAGAVPHA